MTARRQGNSNSIANTTSEQNSTAFQQDITQNPQRNLPRLCLTSAKQLVQTSRTTAIRPQIPQSNCQPIRYNNRRQRRAIPRLKIAKPQLASNKPVPPYATAHSAKTENQILRLQQQSTIPHIQQIGAARQQKNERERIQKIENRSTLRKSSARSVASSADCAIGMFFIVCFKTVCDGNYVWIGQVMAFSFLIFGHFYPEDHGNQHRQRESKSPLRRTAWFMISWHKHLRSLFPIPNSSKILDSK